MTGFRPRLRFSRRTLFVLVTVFGAGLGWLVRELIIVRERKTVLQLVNAKTGDMNGMILPLIGIERNDRRSWIRKLLNDPNEFGRAFPTDMEELRQRYKTAFPDSSAGTYDPTPEYIYPIDGQH